LTREHLVSFEDAPSEVAADDGSVEQMVDKVFGNGGRVFRLALANVGGVPAIAVNVSLDDGVAEIFSVLSVAAGSSEKACLCVPSDWFPSSPEGPKNDGNFLNDRNFAVSLEYDAGFGRRYRVRQGLRLYWQDDGDDSDWRVTLVGAAAADEEVAEPPENDM